MLFPSAPAKNRTSGPKGQKDDNVNAGDKFPAYPEREFPAVCEGCTFVQGLCPNLT
jgi:hypothetical protein